MICDSDSPTRSAAVPTISLIIDLLLVVDVTAGSTNYRANRRALSAAEQRASHRADAGAGRRAPNRFARGGFAVVIVTVAITSVIISVIIVVVPGRGIATPAASVLRHRAWSCGGD